MFVLAERAARKIFETVDICCIEACLLFCVAAPQLVDADAEDLCEQFVSAVHFESESFLERLSQEKRREVFGVGSFFEGEQLAVEALHFGCVHVVGVEFFVEDLFAEESAFLELADEHLEVDLFVVLRVHEGDAFVEVDDSGLEDEDLPAFDSFFDDDFVLRYSSLLSFFASQ